MEYMVIPCKPVYSVLNVTVEISCVGCGNRTPALVAHYFEYPRMT